MQYVKIRYCQNNKAFAENQGFENNS